MQGMVKKVLLALGLVVVCWVILVATKTYGVWVITAIAVVLFILGLLKKEPHADKEADAGQGAKAARPGDQGRPESHG